MWGSLAVLLAASADQAAEPGPALVNRVPVAGDVIGVGAAASVQFGGGRKLVLLDPARRPARRVT